MKVDCTLLRISKKQTLQEAALSIVDSTLRFAISEETASSGVDCAVLSSAITAVAETLVIEAEDLYVVLVRTALTFDLWKDHGFLRCVGGLVVV